MALNEPLNKTKNACIGLRLSGYNLAITKLSIGIILKNQHPPSLPHLPFPSLYPIALDPLHKSLNPL